MNIQFCDDHIKEPNQLFIALSGSKKDIIIHLNEIIQEMNTVYGKPIQGTHIYPESTKQVKTPFLDGKPY
jgi:hypothetical protein